MNADRTPWPWIGLRAAVAAVFIFILAPILITAAVSFNGSPRSVFPPEGFSLRWWGEAFSLRWVEPMLFSLKLALMAALCSAAIGTPLAFALVRGTFRGKTLVEMLVAGPLVLPSLVTGIGLLQMLHAFGMGGLVGFWGLLIGHVVICLPFSVRTVAVSLKGMPGSLEPAAASLGAPPWRVLREVTLPVISGGVFAGTAFSFVHSFTDVNLSLFLASPGEKPVTVAILAFLEFGFAPTLAAVSMLSLFIPLAVIAALERFVPIGDFLYAEGGGRRGG
ncbi:ABC transporter permease [Muricoccus radiodurans]|uniref:ABC transporter permease n=1 Tax=Muricoccus radiodurans TaxID=2231721 RepID=UPI003CE94498